MKLLFLTDNFPPEVNAPATRTYEHCIEWVKQGAEVTVVTCVPNFPQGKVYEGYKNKLYQTEVMDGVKVIRVWSFINPNEGSFKRILDYFSYAVFAFWASLFIKTDVIIATSPQFFTAVCGRWLSFFKRKPWIMEVRDLWPESIRAVNAMNGYNYLLDILEKVELRLYRTSSKVVVVTDAFKENIVARGIDAAKIEVVKNGVHKDKFLPREKDVELIVKLGLGDKFVVGYLGTHGMAHKLDFIFHAIKGKQLDGVHFLFIGDGAEKMKLLKLKEELALDNVTMLPFVSKKEVKKYISITDVALVPLKKSDTFKTVIPSKIFENASMKKPILLGVEGESKDIVEEYNAGVCFEPENEESFLTSLQKIMSPALHQKLQEGCVELADNFDRKKLANRMYAIIENVAVRQK